MRTVMAVGMRVRRRSQEVLVKCLPFSWGWYRSNPLRHVTVLVFAVLLGWVLASVIGVVLYRSSLDSRTQEFILKCDNHKEVPIYPRSILTACLLKILSFVQSPLLPAAVMKKDIIGMSWYSFRSLLYPWTVSTASCFPFSIDFGFHCTVLYKDQG